MLLKDRCQRHAAAVFFYSTSAKDGGNAFKAAPGIPSFERGIDQPLGVQSVDDSFGFPVQHIAVTVGSGPSRGNSALPLELPLPALEVGHVDSLRQEGVALLVGLLDAQQPRGPASQGLR